MGSTHDGLSEGLWNDHHGMSCPGHQWLVFQELSAQGWGVWPGKDKEGVKQTPPTKPLALPGVLPKTLPVSPFLAFIIERP